ncbi:TPA: helix-turn-helix domain-containing protein [Methanocaldococcus jannaschii]|uniref:Uncharacterized protein MJ0769 n=2 Tax=Methanocaldococcus jannaschii TaxID=2190 RepID=Y769_METJA|nr:helix-turn-helix domain-containing protein [Methanocaldococcus jannaschii]Q58179.1 RecName: Full=Uncharacterized protein MJ0769 [Methanocaldococcus jannaschii DSM 2661]AAB98774.1 hypothetical protein MJ_0769 [Methanocaldococcus jannaschii DSM 2661]HII59315.1 helix-turn-helix domain-containing protein [Methanocaldococcus jannaschii]
MIEIKISKIPRWDEINKIVKLREKDLVLLKLPKSVYEHPKMAYKLEYLKKKGIFIEVENAKRGRKRKVDDETVKKIHELIIEGYSVREIGNILGIGKSTVWDYAKDCIKELKLERFKKLVWEYREYLINKGKYSPSLQVLFLELEATVDYDLEKAKKILEDIIKHVKEF